MTGITNRPDNVEEQNQQRVEERKQELPNVPRTHHNPEKNQGAAADDPGRVQETGAGRGLEHQGH